MTTRNAIGLNEETITAASMARQAIINGNFDVWQRGTSFDSTTTPANDDDTYTADRWILLSDGNDIVDVSQESTTFPEGSTYALKAEVETANKKFGLVQILESIDATKFAGGHVSLLFKAYTKTSKAIKNLRAAVISWNGTADTVNSDVVCAWGAEGTNPTLSTTWWSTWGYRKSHVISNSGSELTDYQIKLVVHRSTGSDSGEDVYVGTKCESDYDDIRFTKSDGITLLDYWIEESDIDSATIWVKVDTIAASDDTTIYLYYGNSSATAVSSGDDTFDLFDDFEDGDTSDWTVTAGITVSPSATAYKGSYGAAIVNTSTWPSAYKSFTFDTTYYVHITIRAAQTNARAYMSPEYGTARAAVCFYEDGNIKYYPNSEPFVTLQAYSAGTWYNLKYLVKAANFDLWIDDVLKVTNGAYQTGMPGNRVMWSPLHNATYYMDNLFIRKYAATEPTHGAWGSESTDMPDSDAWTYENTPSNLALVADTWTTFKIEGISVDTSGMTNLAVFIWVDDTDCAVDDVLYISQVQLCAGDVALPFEPKTYAEELDSCKRYFQRLFTDGTNNQRIAHGFAVSTTSFRTVTELEKEMRVTPTITTSSTASHFSVYNGLVSVACSNTPINTGSTPRMLALGGTVASGLTAPDPLFLISAGTAQVWINLDAEL